MGLENEVFVCECASPAHNMIVTKDEEYDEVYLHVHLVNLAFLERVVLGVKYILGLSVKWGHYDTLILGKEKREKLKELL